MEETVGKLWHTWITRKASREYPDAKVELSEIQKKIALWFHAFGGDPGLTIKAASRTLWKSRRSWLARVAGLESQVQLAWRSKEELFLPGAISCFNDSELNESLYLWLAALTATDYRYEQHWLQDSRQHVELTLERWPGLHRQYDALAQAHIAERGWPTKPELQTQEALLREALLHPEVYSPANADLFDVPPVPLWLHPLPPTSPATSKDAPADITAESDQVSEIQSDYGRQGKKVDHSKEDEGLLAFRLESLFSWAEFVNVDRPQEDDEELGAKAAANDLDEFAVSRKSGTVKQRLKFDLDLPASAYDDIPIQSGIKLPEWDYRKQILQPDHCTLSVLETRSCEPTHLPAYLRYSARVVTAFFEHLALNKQWERCQPQGCEIDWDAYLSVLTGWRSGHQESNTGIYREVRRHHRDMSCLLLADLSLSTEAAIDDEHTVIDVVRDGLYLMSEALGATGDRFAIAGFSSRNRSHIRYHPVKSFSEPLSDMIRGRIESIRPGFYTRMGAAIRYATQQLSAESSTHKLLLILSDGKPNDIDKYESRYGIEDTRHALQQAAGIGISPFCVTIDRHGNDYLPYLFGHQRYMVLHRAQQLPTVLPRLYAQLTGKI